MNYFYFLGNLSAEYYFCKVLSRFQQLISVKASDLCVVPTVNKNSRVWFVGVSIALSYFSILLFIVIAVATKLFSDNVLEISTDYTWVMASENVLIASHCTSRHCCKIMEHTYVFQLVSYSEGIIHGHCVTMNSGLDKFIWDFISIFCCSKFYFMQ